MTDAVAEDGLKVIVRWIELLVKTVFKGKQEFLGLIFTQAVFLGSTQSEKSQWSEVLWIERNAYGR